MNKEIDSEFAVSKMKTKHVAGAGMETTLDSGEVSALDLFNTPHSFVKVSRPMIGAGMTKKPIAAGPVGKRR